MSETDNIPPYQQITLNVINPGFTRQGVTEFALPVQPIGLSPWEMLPADVSPNPWDVLQWWESPWQAKIGIRHLTLRPFLALRRYTDDQVARVPTRVLYPFALHSSQEERIERAAYAIAASVRQAREMYTAARSTGVTDVSRPILYFYGALGLAEAATVAIFGPESLEEAHGLGRSDGPSVSVDPAPWPTLIGWRSKGQFPMLYRATRWGPLYACCERDAEFRTRYGNTPPPRFHILECLRVLQYDWGTLPYTGLARQARQTLMLPYHGPEDMYMTSQMALTTPLIQLPRVLVQYMLLYYFSVLARYYTVEWQRLLAADREPEGYVFRVAMERVAQDYLYEIVKLLPNSPPSLSYAQEVWSEVRPEIDEWYEVPTEGVGGPRGLGIPMYAATEWNGMPPDVCVRATQVNQGH